MGLRSPTIGRTQRSVPVCESVRWSRQEASVLRPTVRKLGLVAGLQPLLDPCAAGELHIEIVWARPIRIERDPAAVRGPQGKKSNAASNVTRLVRSPSSSQRSLLPCTMRTTATRPSAGDAGMDHAAIRDADRAPRGARAINPGQLPTVAFTGSICDQPRRRHRKRAAIVDVEGDTVRQRHQIAGQHCLRDIQPLTTSVPARAHRSHPSPRTAPSTSGPAGRYRPALSDGVSLDRVRPRQMRPGESQPHPAPPVRRTETGGRRGAGAASGDWFAADRGS